MLILLIFIWEGKYWNTTFITQFRLFAVSVFKWEGLICAGEWGASNGASHSYRGGQLR